LTGSPWIASTVAASMPSSTMPVDSAILAAPGSVRMSESAAGLFAAGAFQSQETIRTSRAMIDKTANSMPRRELVGLAVVADSPSRARAAAGPGSCACHAGAALATLTTAGRDALPGKRPCV